MSVGLKVLNGQSLLLFMEMIRPGNRHGQDLILITLDSLFLGHSLWYSVLEILKIPKPCK